MLKLDRREPPFCVQDWMGLNVGTGERTMAIHRNIGRRARINLAAGDKLRERGEGKTDPIINSAIHP